MGTLEIFFWVGILVIFYSYVGYGIIIFAVVKIRYLFGQPKQTVENDFKPAVALIIPAYNEAGCIAAKMNNTLLLDYPKDKLRTVFITDGSSDGSPEMIRRHGGFELMHNPERKGKADSMNRVMLGMVEDIVIFNDANTLLNRDSITKLVKHFRHPEVGGVTGEKRIITSADFTTEAAFVGEGMYWRYESFLKKLDGEFYTVVGAAGELFAVRRDVYEPIMPGTIIEDFVLSLKICLKGYVIRYEPGAWAGETASASIRDEQKRKVRISAGGFQAMVILTELLNIFKHPVLSFQYISHRVLRWTICPLSILFVFIINWWLVLEDYRPVYDYLLILQLIFYGMALTGWLFANRNIKVRALIIPYYFFFMNLSVFLGFVNFLQNKQSAMWEKSKRKDFV